MRSRLAELLIAGTALASLLAAPVAGAAQQTPQRSLLALSKRNHTLAVVDPNTLQVVRALRSVPILTK